GRVGRPPPRARGRDGPGGRRRRGAAGRRLRDHRDAARPRGHRARRDRTAMIGPADAETFSRCIAVGGVAVFPADTVYGLACEPDNREAVTQLYFLKRRRPEKPAAVMFFDRELALAALPELGPRTRAALEGLLPGAVTLLLPNPSHRFPLACGPDPETLGLRVPAWPDALAPLGAVRWPVLQSSANDAGGADARTLD